MPVFMASRILITINTRNFWANYSVTSRGRLNLHLTTSWGKHHQYKIPAVSRDRFSKINTVNPKSCQSFLTLVTGVLILPACGTQKNAIAYRISVPSLMTKWTFRSFPSWCWEGCLLCSCIAGAFMTGSRQWRLFALFNHTTNSWLANTRTQNILGMVRAKTPYFLKQVLLSGPWKTSRVQLVW